MNTKKTIGISMIALLVVAMGASMAAATGFSATPDPVKLIDDVADADKALTVTWYHDSVNIDTNWRVLKYDGSGWVDNNEIQMKEDGTATFASSGTQYFVASLPVQFDLKDAGGVDSKPGDRYQIEFKNATGSVVGLQAVTVEVDLIPEFTTIAIPVVALLGLVLFMRRKKD